jgi:hypothetical protein
MIPDSAEAKESASRPLLAAGSPMNTSRGDTSRGNTAQHIVRRGVIEISMETGIHSMPSCPLIIAKCSGFASKKCSRHLILLNDIPLAALHQVPNPAVSGVKQKTCVICVQRTVALIWSLNSGNNDSGKHESCHAMSSGVSNAPDSRPSSQPGASHPSTLP